MDAFSYLKPFKGLVLSSFFDFWSFFVFLAIFYLALGLPPGAVK